MPNMAEPRKARKTFLGIVDQPAKFDALGFAPYVDGIAAFLTHPETEAPLTLSVEGEWGSGKSSFMLQIQERLRRAGKLTVTFNAWRHDTEKALWAAFALKFVRDLSQQIGWPRRVAAKFSLRWRRYNWEEGWTQFLLSALGIFLFIYVSGSLLLYFRRHGFSEIAEITGKEGEQNLIRVLYVTGGAGYIVLGVYVLRKLKEIFLNPITVDLKRYLSAPDYKGHSDFIEDFHKDFSNIVGTYARATKVFVFIDDLDRCEVPKAADLMQALNLMISNSPRIVFIIGMDRDKVAAGLAVKYEKVLPYLAPSLIAAENGDNPADAGAAKPSFDPIAGLEFGYSFIEKFVQVPFQVPRPTPHNIDQMVTTYVDRCARSGASDDSQSYQNTDSSEMTDVQDSSTVQQLIQIVASAFDYNPRRIKQFINVFRLRWQIASSTNLFAEPEPQSGYDPLTPERLGKFVAITLRWPLLVADLHADHELLRKLQLAAWGEELPLRLSDRRFARWSSKPQLMQLLKEGFSEAEGNDPQAAAAEVRDAVWRQEKLKYGLTNVNIADLFQVSPPLTRPSQAIPPQSDAYIDALETRGVLHLDPARVDISTNESGLIDPAAASTRKREGVVIEPGRMPDSSLLSQILFHSKGGQSEFLESITKGVAQIGGTPEVAQQIRDLFDIDIPSIFVGAWKQTLKTTLDESTKAPEELRHVSLAEHTIDSEHHPYLEIRVRGIAVKKIQFTLKFSFSLRGFTLRIQNGMIKEIGTGTCEATGTMLFQDIVIAEFSTPIRLPGLMSVPADEE